jgi:hypothetical protein
MFLYSLLGFCLAATSADVDFTSVKKGETVPFSGKLLTEEAMAEIIATHEYEINQLKIDKELERKTLEASLNLKYDLYYSECELKKSTQREMITIRDEEIKRQQTKDIFQRASFTIGFILGAGGTILITHSVNQN